MGQVGQVQKVGPLGGASSLFYEVLKFRYYVKFDVMNFILEMLVK